MVVASAGSFADALAAAPLAAQHGGPLLLVQTRTTQPVLDEVARLGARRATIVGAVGAVPLVVQEELARAGVQVSRIAGDGRFDTAALIARAVGAPAGEAVVASGADFADALAVAPIAAAAGLPVLLTERGALPEDTAAALAELGIRRTLVVGGRAAVSDAVLAQLPDPRRVAGADRYATAAALAEEALARGATLGTVVVATGAAFPDGLAGGPLAARRGGPLLLVGGGSTAAAELLAAHAGAIRDLLVLGGTAAVPDAAVTALQRAARP